MGFDLPLFNISGASNCQGFSQSPDFGGKSWFPKIFLFCGTIFILEETIIIRSWLFPICLIVGFWDWHFLD